MLELHKSKVRAALAPRRDPYWGAPIGGKGRVIGYRKIDAESGSWIARMRDEQNKKVFQALGADRPEFSYNEAQEAALKWFSARDGGVTDINVTVAAACREYVKDRTVNKSEECGAWAQQMFDRSVYKHPIASIKLERLRKPHIEDWRNGLAAKDGTPFKKGSRNRYLRTLKAALNLAVANGRITADATRAWNARMGGAQMLAGAEGRRELYLEASERRALIDACFSRGLRDLVTAAALTGARTGELVNAKRSQFDARTGVMTFISAKGHAGPRARKVMLSDAALALFTKLSRSKLPGAFLFMHDDGHEWKKATLTDQMRDAVARAGLPKATCFYTLRHSFITQAITDGMSCLEVARMCGTSVIQIEKHYGHLAQGESTRARLNRVQAL